MVQVFIFYIFCNIKKKKCTIYIILFIFRSKIDFNGEETWEFTGKYWEVKKNPGFSGMSFEQLW